MTPSLNRLARRPTPCSLPRRIADRDREVWRRPAAPRLPCAWSCSGRTGRRAAARRSAISAAWSGLSAPRGGFRHDRRRGRARTARVPIAAPPSLTKSCVLNFPALPMPITIRRATGSDAGATMSSALPLLPVKRSAAAARCSRSPVGASILRDAGPSFSPSSHSTISTPFGGVENRFESEFEGLGHLRHSLLQGCWRSEWSARAHATTAP